MDADPVPPTWNWLPVHQSTSQCCSAVARNRYTTRYSNSYRTRNARPQRLGRRGRNPCRSGGITVIKIVKVLPKLSSLNTPPTPMPAEGDQRTARVAELEVEHHRHLREGRIRIGPVAYGFNLVIGQPSSLPRGTRSHSITHGEIHRHSSGEFHLATAGHRAADHRKRRILRDGAPISNRTRKVATSHSLRPPPHRRDNQGEQNQFGDRFHRDFFRSCSGVMIGGLQAGVARRDAPLAIRVQFQFAWQNWARNFGNEARVCRTQCTQSEISRERRMV